MGMIRRLSTFGRCSLILLICALLLTNCGWTAACAEEDDEHLPEKPESDPLADVEDAEEWEMMFEYLPLSGDWALDLVTVAEIQLGYTESSENFEAVLNAEKDGYDLFGWTRFGAWYGLPYGDWCATFISFCLYFAGIPDDVFPYDSGTVNWADTLINRGLFQNRWEYTPKRGDLVFFDWEGDYRADHVGIVCSVDAATGRILTVEGNRSPSVELYEYAPDYGFIMGFGVLPENPNASTGAAGRTESAEAAQSAWTPAGNTAGGSSSGNFVPVKSFANHIGGITVYVEAGAGAIPEDTMLTMSPINGRSFKDIAGEALSGDILEIQAVHLLFHDPHGTPVTPQKPVQVTLYPQSFNYTSKQICVLRITEDNKVKTMVSYDDLQQVALAGLRFEAQDNAIYAIVNVG